MVVGVSEIRPSKVAVPEHMTAIFAFFRTSELFVCTTSIFS